MTGKSLWSGEGVCPWWLLPTFDNPLRRLVQNPERILGGLVQPGQVAADIGCGMGYFTLPLARMLGEQGRVYAVDLQAEMLAGLKRRAVKAGLLERITLHLTPADRLELPEQVEFALTFWMVHETIDPQVFLSQVRALLKPDGRLLLVEPVIHVGQAAYDRTIRAAQAVGFTLLGPLPVNLSRAALLAVE